MTVTRPILQEQRQEYRNFINSIKSPATLRTYTYSLKYFMAYCKTDIPGLLKGDTKALEGRIMSSWFTCDKNKSYRMVLSTQGLQLLKNFTR
jgi:hypothetical protein